jgi:fructosamine-3-kinase
MSDAAHDRWDVFYATERLAPMLELAGRGLDPDASEKVSEVIRRCAAGCFDDADALAHVVLFGAGYLRQTRAAATRCLEIS